MHLLKRGVRVNTRDRERIHFLLKIVRLIFVMLPILYVLFVSVIHLCFTCLPPLL